MSYDSTIDTINHIKAVQTYLSVVITNLMKRSANHDQSKLSTFEKEIFDEFTPKLKNSTYGSDEYMQFLKDMKPALDHHYANNSHHPEHYENGIKDMSLLDLIEMLMDWKASSERHDDGNIWNSIEINQKRFGYSDELKQIFKNTIEEIVFR